MRAKTNSDNEIMDLVQSGDISKIGLLYERHHKELFAYFFRMTRHRQRSEDLVQNTFVKIIKHNKNFTGRGQFIYWLFSIAKNIWIDEFRKNDIMKYYKEIDDNEIGFPSEENTGNHFIEERKKLLKIALYKLSHEKREAIVLSRYHGLNYQEIAEVCQSTENTIKSRINRGLDDIKNIIKQIQTV